MYIILFQSSINVELLNMYYEFEIIVFLVIIIQLLGKYVGVCDILYNVMLCVVKEYNVVYQWFLELFQFESLKFMLLQFELICF